MNKDLTTGKPTSVLLRFTLPILLSVAFQQLYNIADSVIAGKFAGEDALAAVGASYPVTMIFMAVAFGMNIGISVVISQLFGAKDFKEMKTAAYTGFISVAVLGVVLTVVGTVLCEPILRMLGTPENIMEDTALYLAIYIWGLLFLFIYNISSGVFVARRQQNAAVVFDRVVRRQHRARCRVRHHIPLGRRRCCVGDVPRAGRGFRVCVLGGLAPLKVH